MIVPALSLAANPAPGEAKPDRADVEFFEKSIRPILVARCLSCHGAEKQKGELRLDGRSAILTGGSTGPAVVPGNPKESLLVDAINYGDTVQMPPKSKLPPDEIATLTDWVKRGAPWGIDRTAPRVESGKKTASGIPGQISSEEFRERTKFWSFQPLRRPLAPDCPATERAWARNAIDLFIAARHRQLGLEHASEAGKRTLIRRLTLDLTGVPPTTDEVAAFLADSSSSAYESLVDRLLASPRYGERTARHWLDLVRFAETAGHEFDYDLPNAFRYRDYVIRAFNLDLPYDQFVTEQIAGDLAENPRRHPVERFNESIIGTGFYFLGEGTHSPVDLREEESRRVDNQLDVISKTFLGLTLACARCHDHKFDPIRAADYYALAGFLKSSRHQQAPIDPDQSVAATIARRRQAMLGLASALTQAAARLPDPLKTEVAAWLSVATTPEQSIRPKGGKGSPDLLFEDFDRTSFDGWLVSGSAFGERPSVVGDLRFFQDGKASRLTAIPAGVAHSGRDSDRLTGVLRSRTFTIEHRFIHLLASGRRGKINVVVDGFEKIRDPIYGGLAIRVDHGDQPHWLSRDLAMWIGHSAYIEISDGAATDFSGGATRIEDGNGYIAVDEIRFSNVPAPAPPPGPPASVDIDAVLKALESSSPSLADRISRTIDQVNAIDRSIPEPTLAMAITDGTGLDERIHIRGGQSLGATVPRRFLEVLGGTGMATIDEGSGRLELARRMVDPAGNPLLPRVMVNRIWKHLFGEGLVKSTDDFGAMGQNPSNPELLDWLASEFVASGWSVKAMVRLIATSSTYRMSSIPNPLAERLDPTNTYLHRMNLRRMEAEVIRDSLLSVSGRLDSTMYGRSIAPYLTPFMDGRGRPMKSGPLDGDGRRGIYLNVRRNFLNPMFLAFDMPVPFSTMGRRNVSNVPAQALTMMNDPLVTSQASLWAERTRKGGIDQSPRERIETLYLTAFSRPPTPPEIAACLDYLQSRGHSSTAWTDLCHVLINSKEFIYY
jgi:cytochrome c553